MSTWRDPIFRSFTPEIAAVARLTIVTDPDGLMTEAAVIEGIRERGFEVVAFEDHVSFRYFHEARFRRAWDAGQTPGLVVASRGAREGLSELPFDLLLEAQRHARVLSYSLADLFPGLQPHVVAEVESADLDALFYAHKCHRPEDLGVNATREFILRHVYEVAPELIKSESDLLRMLLRRHYVGRLLPRSMDDHLLGLLIASGRWSDWSLDEILTSRGAFFAFLQERWPHFLQSKTSEAAARVGEPAVFAGLRYNGPVDLPFEHDDVRVYIDNLFAEGLLAPTAAPNGVSSGAWYSVGVVSDVADDSRHRMGKLVSRLAKDRPGVASGYRDWLLAAQRLAEADALRWGMPTGAAESDVAPLAEVHDELDRSFSAWLQLHYSALASLSPWPRPIMLHHIPRFLSHGVTSTGVGKCALIVVDGLSLDLWAALRDAWAPKREWVLDEGAVFAWVPTLTSVSRQAIFAGEPPYFFSASIATTAKEEQHWVRFWENARLQRREVAYFCQGLQEDEDAYRERIGERLRAHKCRALAIVIGTVDLMLHGAAVGADGVHAGVRHWASRGAMLGLVDSLLDDGFKVYLTADHGYVDAEGIGKPDVGVTAEQRGARVHIFRDAVTRERCANQYPGTWEWPSTGIPVDYLPLLAPDRKAFAGQGRRTVSHGGACMSEVIVPFVHIAKVK